jgi:hypothetical protein
LGQALAVRWAQAGYRVLIGSRTADKAHIGAREITTRLPLPLESGTNTEIAARVDERDAGLVGRAACPVRICDTLMSSLADRERVARCALELAAELS